MTRLFIILLCGAAVSALATLVNGAFMLSPRRSAVSIPSVIA